MLVPSDAEVLNKFIFKPFKWFCSLFEPKTIKRRKNIVKMTKSTDTEEKAWNFSKVESYPDRTEKDIQVTKNTNESVGVEKIGDLNDYEYTSDGKRMCFINIHTGNRIYSGDPLWNDLKKNII